MFATSTSLIRSGRRQRRGRRWAGTGEAWSGRAGRSRRPRPSSAARPGCDSSPRRPSPSSSGCRCPFVLAILSGVLMGVVAGRAPSRFWRVYVRVVVAIVTSFAALVVFFGAWYGASCPGQIGQRSQERSTLMAGRGSGLAPRSTFPRRSGHAHGFTTVERRQGPGRTRYFGPASRRGETESQAAR
jgi:hypothetical protein